MRTVNNLSAVMNMPQWIFFGILALGVAFFLLVFCYFIYLLVYKPELKAEIAAKARMFKEEQKRIKLENERNMAEIKRSAKEIDEKAKRTSLLEDEIAKMRDELIAQGVEEERAREISNMTLSQLQRLKSKEMTDVSGAFIINAITRKVLIDSEFERRTDIEDFKVPVNKTTAVSLDTVQTYLSSFTDATHSGGAGKTAATYKTDDKSFILLTNHGGGKFKLTVKCGSYYGLRLAGLYPEFVRKAKFPYGMIWFELENTGECSFELIKLLITISYNIAKAGY